MDLEPCCLRPAASSDAQSLSELAVRSKGHWGYSDAFLAACRQELTVTVDDIRNPAKAYVVCEMDKVITGFFAIERLSHAQYELEALFVAPELIGLGYGRRLFEQAKVSVRQRGGCSMLIQGDPNAESFYVAMGAEKIGERESASVPGRLLPEFLVDLTETDQSLCQP